MKFCEPKESCRAEDSLGELLGLEEYSDRADNRSSLSTWIVILLGSLELVITFRSSSAALEKWLLGVSVSVFPEYDTKIRTVSGVSVALGVAGSESSASLSCSVVWLTERQEGRGVEGLCEGLPRSPLCTTSPSLCNDRVSLCTSPLVRWAAADCDGEWLLECLNLSVGDLGDRTDCTDRVSGEMSDRPDCMEAASMSPRLARVTEDSVERSAAEVSEVLARDAREPPTPPRLLTSSMLHSREYLEPGMEDKRNINTQEVLGSCGSMTMPRIYCYFKLKQNENNLR